MIRLAFKLSGEGSPVSGSRRVLDVDLAPPRADEAAAALRHLVRQIPEHPGILRLLDAGVAGGRAFLVTEPVTGDALDVALALYGPAAFDDALPRLELLAGALDAAAARGVWHGALQPRDIIVSADETRIIGLGVFDVLTRAGAKVPCTPPYAAPEVLLDGATSPGADQHALAAIAYEWLLGRRITAPVTEDLDLSALPDVDRAAAARAFARAMALDPMQRFASCSEFVRALAAAADSHVVEPDVHESVPVGPKYVELGEDPTPADLPIQQEEIPEHASPIPAAAVSVPGVGVRLSLSPDEGSRSEGFGLASMAAALLLGVAIGAAGALLLLRSGGAAQLPGVTSALQLAPAIQPSAEPPVASPEAAAGVTEGAAGQTPQNTVGDPQLNPPRDDLFTASSQRPPAPAAKAPPAPAAPAVSEARATAPDAALLVHSVPEGAAVAIDGEPRGKTPVAVRGLALGTRTVNVSYPGYQPVQRQVTLTAERPSRTVEVELRAASGRGASTATSTARTGTLVVDSRPAGAAVLLNGRRAGVTPLTLSGVTPGTHTVRLERPGYRSVTTSVAVRAGERARVAARLEGEREPR